MAQGKHYFEVNSSLDEKFKKINNDKNIQYSFFDCNKWVEDIDDFPEAKLHPCKLMDHNTCGGVSLTNERTKQSKYYQLGHDRRTIRLIWLICEKKNGKKEKGQVVRHLCQEDSRCIQKHHVVWGTQKQNINDRTYSGFNTRKGQKNEIPYWFVGLIKERLFDGFRSRKIIDLYKKYFKLFNISEPEVYVSLVKNEKRRKKISILSYTMNEVNNWLQGETS